MHFNGLEWSKTYDFEKKSKQLEILPNTYFKVSEHSASFSHFRKKVAKKFETIYIKP